MSTNRIRFFKRHDIPITSSLSIQEIAKLSKMPLKALKEVYSRGLGAYSSNPLSVRLKTGEKNIKAPMSKKMSAEQWAFGRVYAFVMKTPKVFLGSDNDIAKKYKIKD